MRITTQVFGPNDDGWDGMVICINGHERFRITAGEAEDFSVRRDLSVCLGIPSLLSIAHEAGQNGEDLEITRLPDRPWEEMP